MYFNFKKFFSLLFIKILYYFDFTTKFIVEDENYLNDIKNLKFKMCIKFMTSLMDILTKDFRKEIKLDRKSNFGNRTYGNDYLIRKEEYGNLK